MTGASSRKKNASVETPVSAGAARLASVTVLLLIAIGLTMLFSIGIGQSRPLHYPVRQAVFAIVAITAGIVTSRIPIGWWKALLPWMCAATVILLLLARFAGPNINGAHRWLIFGPVSFQPSEVGKLTAIVWIAYWVSRYRRRVQEFWRGFILPAVGLGGTCLLVLLGPDFGTTMLIGATGVFLMYIAGTRLIYLFISIVAAAGGLFWLILDDEERLSRITSFLNPEKYADDEAYQLMNSLYGFMEGGLWGKGVGQSMQKNYYLPESHTDFILAIIAEELGVIGTLTVMALFLVFFFSGMYISWRSPDPFARLMGFGITILITLQAGINVGVVTGSMPTKGLPLPFISHGGSNLVIMVAMVGILVRIAYGEADSSKQTRVLQSSQQWI
jgi:cell division protein FtsW